MSIAFELETVINRPIEDVFERIATISNYSDWLPKTGLFISTEQGVDGPVTLGTPYTDETTIGTWHGEVIKFERPHKIEFRHQLRWFGIPVMETRPGYQLEANGGATKVCHTAKGKLYGIFKLMREKVDEMARAERKRTLTALEESMQPSP